MNENLEYNFLQNQINSNNQIRSVLQHEITTLMALIHQKRQWIDKIEENDRLLSARMDAIGHKNKTLVHYENSY